MNKTINKTDFSQKILIALDDQKIEPKPRWHFVFQEGSVWIMGTAATFCGAMAVSATLFVFVTAPLRFQPATHDNLFSFWLDFMPLLWICLFVIFVLGADYILLKTKRGYRHNLILITSSSAALSIILGYVGFVIGLGEYLESRVSAQIPFYTPMQITINESLHQPEHGLITGQIEGSKNLILRVNDDSFYNLDISEVPDMQKSFFIDGSIVSVIGTTTSDDMFVVCMVIPYAQNTITPEYFESERNPDEVRTNTCKGVRPYQRLQNKLLMNYEHK